MNASGATHLKLGAFLQSSGHHLASWRHPSAPLHAAFNLEHYLQMAQTAERGLFDLVFLADGLSVIPEPRFSNQYVAIFEPLTMLAAMAMRTSRVGLVATASSTYNEPFHVARKFASLDYMSNGRAGWNLVTSGNPQEAGNFSQQSHMEHDERYEKAAEFAEVVTGLWDSWEPDAIIEDRQTGMYIDAPKLHALNHKGKYFSVRGPLNAPPSPQGQPVRVQAGSSEAGRAFAARFAEIVFTSHQVDALARAFYQDIKRIGESVGRDTGQIKIMPGIVPYVGKTRSEAEERREQLQQLMRPDVAVKQLSAILGGVDLSGYPLDRPLQSLPANVPMMTMRAAVLEASQQGLTLTQVAMKFAGARSHLDVAGTASDIADVMEHWFKTGCCDGFNVMPPLAPQMLERFVDEVVPELQRRSLYRTAYEGKTLRDHLGLRVPENRYVTSQKRAPKATAHSV